jgi:hypothetical protein
VISIYAPPREGGLCERVDTIHNPTGALGFHSSSKIGLEANISITQNNITAPGAVEAPFQGNIDAYVDGRWSDIQAHETSRFAAGVQDDELPALEIQEPEE